MGAPLGASPPPPMAVDLKKELPCQPCGRGQPDEAEAGTSPLSVTFTAEAMDLATKSKPSPKPLPRSKLPTFEPLQLVHSGLSGDLDSLLLPDELEDDSHLACA